MKNLNLILSMVLATSIGACTGQKQTVVDKGTQDQVLHLGNGAEPQDLDPQIVTGVPEHNILSALFEGLVGQDPKDLHPVPGVAESWTISKDQKVYEFKIRKDARWSNGEPLNANDFVLSWKRMLAPTLAAEYAYMLHFIKNAEDYNKGKIQDFKQVGVEAVNDYLLKVTLKAPTPFFLSVLQHYSTFPVHTATIEKHGKADARGSQWTRAGNLVSNGPFTLKEWNVNKVVAVAKNPLYWDSKLVKLKEIHFYPIDSQQTEEKNFRAGQLHHTYEVPLNKIAVYQKENPELIKIEPYLGTYFYRLNVTKKPLDNKLVRKAIGMAIDRQMLVDKVTKGGELAAFSFVPPNTAGYTSQHRMTYDLEQAKKLLAQAGYPGGKGLPPVEILFNTSEKHKVIAEAVQQMLKKNLNIDVTLSNQDWKVYLDSQRTLNYHASRSAWIGDYQDPTNFMDMFITGGGNNNTGWSNKTYDQLIAQAGMTADTKKRYELFQKAEQILMDEAPIVPIYTYTRVTLLSPDVKGWYANILDTHPYKHVYLSKEKDVQLSKN